MRDPHYGRMCFKSGGSPFLAVKKASAFGLGPFSQLRMESSSGFILYIYITGFILLLLSLLILDASALVDLLFFPVWLIAAIYFTDVHQSAHSVKQTAEDGCIYQSL